MKPVTVSDPSQPYKIALAVVGLVTFAFIGWAVLDELEDIKAYLSVIAVQEI